ncbi:MULTISPECIES: aminotransferase class I/II-fold pyridoxal phosphate-dependent enzyme [unclassified Curtobacterium]|uniref:aminotransferase class I/II-fold pyridoxal phosphate-dependent enzyme n=1 Tax=unclassified Curtobacterium TaxID=257496 RepID=UPI000DA84F36|nr:MULTISPECIES: aminotransferase class I/II-fold pyridoxal phosphate-dependent enzyme [unclassified Curtobacterium]PZE25320.1 aminotransferase [Curtobacterium sp. MCBD17_028]WIE53837.1 aminotransferase class I/II-fold pyridoxal phosphate-dependent enzyme [Curtobacterium sp. MCBD17_003]
MRTTGPWLRAAEGAMLLAPDGRPAPTVFAEMSALAAATGAINLGQGFPDQDGPAAVVEAAAAAVLAGVNQYPPGRGIPDLRAAIAEHQRRFHGIDLDPEREVLVTAGATEALAATLLALVDTGDEVVTFEPFYDAYGALIRLAGGTHVTVPLVAPDFLPDEAALRAAVTDRTRVILVNTPHNPTGRVLPREVLATIVELAEQHDAVILTDEVYEHLTFGVPHVPIATLPGAWERTVTVSSAGKTFSTTGWKIGWLSGPAALVEAALAVKQFLTFVNGAPFQPAVAVGLRLPDAVFQGVADDLRVKRDLLAAGLTAAGFDVMLPDATYFVIADAAPLGAPDARALCLDLPRLAGVVGVPVTAFVRPDHAAGYRSLVRFAFCKRREVLEEAAGRLAALRATAV